MEKRRERSRSRDKSRDKKSDRSRDKPKDGKKKRSSRSVIHRLTQASSSSSKSSRSSSSSRSKSDRSRSRRSRGSVSPPPEEQIKVTFPPNSKAEHKAIREFTDVDFPKEFFAVFKESGFVKPTPIQANAIPIALNSSDVIGIAKTGSGKTLSFGLPALMILEDEKRYYKKKGKTYDNRRTPRALVLAPTRELCQQIYDSARPFARKIGIDMAVAYGGANPIPQKEAIANGCDLLVATPGRLFDFINRKQVYLDKVFFFVLDEADRMLDMGFMPQVEKILEHIKSSRQTLLWSATWPKEVEELSRKVCKNDPVTIRVGSESLTINQNIKQNVMCLEPDEKFQSVLRVVKDCVKSGKDKILVFTNTKLDCDTISRRLETEGFEANAIHGDKNQQARDAIIHKFKTGRKNILVATDVASRGLDIKDIKVVINYDFPSTIEDYIHRIGRTGRAGKTGDSFSFFTHKDGALANELISVVNHPHLDPEEGQPRGAQGPVQTRRAQQLQK